MKARGFFKLEFCRHGGILVIGVRKEGGGGFKAGISSVLGQTRACFFKMLFHEGYKWMTAEYKTSIN